MDLLWFYLERGWTELGIKADAVFPKQILVHPVQDWQTALPYRYCLVGPGINPAPGQLTVCCATPNSKIKIGDHR